MLLDVLGNAGNYSFLDIIIRILSSIAVVFVVMPLYSLARAYVATKLGDPTPRYSGDLTINPFAHIDYFGALLTLLVGIGFTKGVRINPRNFDNPKKGMALVSLAGPLACILSSFISIFIYYFLLYTYFNTEVEIFYHISSFFSFIAVISANIAVFNLIPLPPFDGGMILAMFLPSRLYNKMVYYERYIYFGVLLLLVTDILTGPIILVRTLLIRILEIIPRILFF